MSSAWIAGLRSVALNVPDLARAEEFYTRVWHLDVVARTDGALYLRGTGAAHHLLALHRRADAGCQIRHVTLQARSRQAFDQIAGATVEAGGAVVAPLAPVDEPGGGVAMTIRDPQGRVLQIVHGDAIHADAHEAKDRPLRLAHVVLNSHDVAAAQAFFERALDFRMLDRTRIMCFLNWPTRPTACRPSSPVGSSSGCPSPGPSSTGR